jgi:hypothetical protein
MRHAAPREPVQTRLAMKPSLAQQRIAFLRLPAEPPPQRLEDMQRVLRGESVDAELRIRVHDQFAWTVGRRFATEMTARHPDLRWTGDRFAVRAIAIGPSAAEITPFPDGSQLIVAGSEFLAMLFVLSNLLVFIDVEGSRPESLIRRLTQRRKAPFDIALKVAASLRHLVLAQRLTGRMPQTVARLDDDAGEIAMHMAFVALTFVLAHETGHIALGHDSMPETPYDPERGSTTLSEAQELQADLFAINLLTDILPEEDRAAVAWAAFIALFARQVTESALYIRRSGTHPRAFGRWAVLDDRISDQEPGDVQLRAALMMGVGAALERSDHMTADLWAILGAEAAANPATLERWDLLQTSTLEPLLAEVAATATPQGQALLDHLHAGRIDAALDLLGVRASTRAKLLDRTAALSFYTLKRAVEVAPDRLTAGDETTFNIVAARLAANHLKGDHVDDW